MSDIFTYYAVPAALYLALVLMPQGRAALWASMAVGAALVALWLGFRSGMMAKILPDPQSSSWVPLLSLLGLTLAWFVANTMQVLRKRVPDTWPIWAWPLVSLIALLAISLVIFRGGAS